MELTQDTDLSFSETTSTFSCSYRSHRKLSIQMSAVRDDSANYVERVTESSAATRPPSPETSLPLRPVSDYVARYTWGAMRKWAVELPEGHVAVVCVVTEVDGSEVGWLRLLVDKGARLSEHQTNAHTDL